MSGILDYYFAYKYNLLFNIMVIFGRKKVKYQPLMPKSGG